jgi:hypothetical protein
LVEEMAGINRAWRGFRMKLNAHERMDPMPDALIGAVIRIGEPWFPSVWEGLSPHRIPVVL